MGRFDIIYHTVFVREDWQNKTILASANLEGRRLVMIQTCGYLEYHPSRSFISHISAQIQAAMFLVILECPATSVPEGMRQTGMEGALNGTRKAAYS
jgi:hypothetical protein